MNADHLTLSLRRRGRFSIEIGDGMFVTVTSKRHYISKSRTGALREERDRLAAEDEALRDRIYGLLTGVAP